MERPDIVVATPARALAHLKAKTLDLKSSLEIVIIDEADLVFSFGYEDDMKQVLKWVKGWKNDLGVGNWACCFYTFIQKWSVVNLKPYFAELKLIFEICF